jgi:hypothetical protein
VVAPGIYFTAINIHNPTYREIGFRKKIAIALPGERPGPVSRPFRARLGPDEALEIDCPDIRSHVAPEYSQTDFLKGFVVIESDVELDVVAVYTASAADGQVETLHIERVPPRRQEVELPDLVPVPDARAEVGFSRCDQGILTVTVLNQGASGAGPSITEVNFLAYGKVSLPTPPLGPGASFDLLFPIPQGCFDPECESELQSMRPIK